MAKRRRPKWSTLIIIGLVHIIAVFGLASALAPKWTNEVVEEVGSMVTVTITASPDPEPTPDPTQEPRPDEGAAAPEAPKAKPKEVVAPEPKIKTKSSPAPKAKSKGKETRSGGGEKGDGTGAGGQGNGTGSGRSGDGQGNGRKPPPSIQKVGPKLIATISDSSQFPIPPGGRKARIGTKTIVRLNVSANGSVIGCRVTQSSGFPDTDATVCRLAPSQVRFEPARDQFGKPMASSFLYQQRYFN